MKSSNKGQVVFWIVFTVAVVGLAALLAGGVSPSARTRASFQPPAGFVSGTPDVIWPGGAYEFPPTYPNEGPISFGPGGSGFAPPAGIIGCGSPPGSEPCPGQQNFPPPDTGSGGGSPLCFVCIPGISPPECCRGSGIAGVGGGRGLGGPGQPESGGGSNEPAPDRPVSGTGAGASGCGPEEKEIIDYIVDNNGVRKSVKVCVKPASSKKDECPAPGTGGWDWFERQGSSCIGHMDNCPIAGYVRDLYNQCVKPVADNEGKIIDVIFRPKANITQQCAAHGPDSDQCGNALMIYQKCKNVYNSAGLSGDKLCS